MNVEEWRAKRAAGEEGELPSGLTVVLQKVHILDLVAQGNIPQQLQPVLEAQMQGKATPAMDLEQLKAYREMVGVVAIACIKEPQGLTAEELPMQDKMAIYQWAMGGSNKLATFHRKKKESLELAQSRNGVRPTAKQSHRPRA